MAQMAVHAEHVLSLFLTEDVTFFFSQCFRFPHSDTNDILSTHMSERVKFSSPFLH